MKMDRQIQQFVNEWSSLQNQDVLDYFRDGMRYVGNTNVDTRQLEALIRFAEAGYQTIRLELLDEPLVQQNRVAAQWRMQCSDPVGGLVIPESVGLSGADFFRSSLGKVRDIDVYFDGRDIAQLERLLAPSDVVVKPPVQLLTKDKPNKGRYRKSGLNQAAMAQIAAELQQVMASQQVYLDSSLNLTKLAALVRVKPNYLSQVISQYMQTSFFEMVAGYRIEEVKQRLSDNPNSTLLDIAYSVGFNSKSAFYNEFRKRVGMTPAQYRKHSTTV